MIEQVKQTHVKQTRQLAKARSQDPLKPTRSIQIDVQTDSEEGTKNLEFLTDGLSPRFDIPVHFKTNKKVRIDV